MENYTPISALDPANDGSENDLYPLVQSGGTHKQTLQGLRQAIVSAWSSPIKVLLGAKTVGQAKTAIGLDRLDNTADREKPISLAQQSALDQKGAAVDVARATTGVSVLAKTRDAVFRKSVALELPLNFKDYGAAYVAVGSPSQGYIYPQGHCYDEAGRVYIKYANGSRAVVAWYQASGVYGGWFMVAAGGESLAIVAEGGVRKLYSKAGASAFNAYDISTLPAKGVTLTGVNTGLTGVGLQYAYEGGRWIIEQQPADVGTEGSRTRWLIYDKDFNRQGEFYVAKNVVGWQLPSNAHYAYVPKTQGVALQGGRVLFGLGGSYIPENDGPTSRPVAAVGIAVCELDGSLVDYGTVRADKLVGRLSSAGYTCLRMESEGLSLRPDGSISHILITVRPSSPDASTGGILLVTEYDTAGDSYADISDPYVPFNMERTFTGVFPRGADGRMSNPFTGEVFSTMQEILRYVADVQAPRFSWYSSAVSITPMGGIEIPPATRVEIFNQNNQAFLVLTWTSAREFVAYWVNLTANTTEMLGTRSGYLKNGFASAGDIIARYLAPHRDSSQADILTLQQLSTDGGNLILVGGGSALYTASTRTWFHAAANTATKAGTKIAEIFTNGFNPGEDNGFDLGAALKRWREAFISKLTLYGPMRLGQYTMATRPAASAYPDYTIEVIDAPGGIRTQRSNGTTWIDTCIPAAQLGMADGVAALDATGKVPAAQMNLDSPTVNGALGIGAAPSGSFILNVRGTPPSQGSQYGVMCAPLFGVGGFGSAYGGAVNLPAQASPVTVPLTATYTGISPALGANVSVTEHNGFRVDSVNNAAIAIACSLRTNQAAQAGLDRWNLYASGSAPNYMSGDLRIGTLTQSGSDKLTVSGPARLTGAFRPGQYTLATLPDPALFPGYIIEVTNAAGGSKTCKSNGTAWKLLNTDMTVS